MNRLMKILSSIVRVKVFEPGYIYNVDAADVKLRAERRLGEMLADTTKNEGGEWTHKSTGNIVLPVLGNPPPTLADMGIGKMDSHRWQQMAKLPEPESEYLEKG